MRYATDVMAWLNNPNEREQLVYHTSITNSVLPLFGLVQTCPFAAKTQRVLMEAAERGDIVLVQSRYRSITLYLARKEPHDGYTWTGGYAGIT